MINFKLFFKNLRFSRIFKEFFKIKLGLIQMLKNEYIND
jgi:hypothetical protein